MNKHLTIWMKEFYRRYEVHKKIIDLIQNSYDHPLVASDNRWRFAQYNGSFEVIHYHRMMRAQWSACSGLKYRMLDCGYELLKSSVLRWNSYPMLSGLQWESSLDQLMTSTIMRLLNETIIHILIQRKLYPVIYLRLVKLIQLCKSRSYIIIISDHHLSESNCSMMVNSIKRNLPFDADHRLVWSIISRIVFIFLTMKYCIL